MTHYAVLGVPHDAGERAIRSAFRTLARRYHPDAGEGSSADAFRRLVEAYETLIDPARRRDYDRSLHRSPPRAQVSIPVEPLAPRVEPLSPRRRRPSVSYSSAAPFHPAPSFDDLFNELWSALQGSLFGTRIRSR